MIPKYLLYVAAAVFSASLTAGEIAAERYTKVREGSLQKIFSMTKNNSCISNTIPVKDALPVIVPDEDIYRNLDLSLTNIAVTDSNNTLLPFVYEKLYKWSQTVNYTPLAGKITAFTVNSERNEAIIDYQITGTQITSVGKLDLQPYSRKKFNKTVTLEFDDQSKVENLKFFNHQQVVDFSRYTFEFTPVKTRNIRIKISPFSEKHTGDSLLIRQGNKENFSETQVFTEELSLNKITFYQAEVKTFPLEELTAEKSFKYQKKNAPENQSCIEFDLGKYPVKELQIFSSTPNYHRKYELEFRIKLKHTDKEAVYCRFSGVLTPESKLKFDEIRANKAILTIENNADAPLADLRFQWTAPLEALIIDPAADLDNFKLYYGGDVDKLPEFDFKHYAEKYNGKEYYQLLLSDEKDNPAYKKANYTVIDFLKKLLPYIIAAAAVAIAFISFKMLKKVNMASGETE